MYNYFLNERKKHTSSQVQLSRLTEQKYQKYKIQRNKQLIKRYIQRTTHGYEKMVDANSDIHNYRQYHHQFRDFDKKRNIGPPAFYFCSRTDKQRINNAVKKNQDLDQVPFFKKSNPSSHKFRQNKSECNFKYTSYNTASRVIQTVHNMKTNQVPNCWDFNVRKYLKTQRQSRHGDSNTTQRSIKKTILPNLNIKHHPKSIQSINNRLILGPLKNALNQKKNMQSRVTRLRGTKKAHLNVKFSTFHVRSQLQSQNSRK